MQHGFDFNEQASTEVIDNDAIILKGFVRAKANQLVKDAELISQQSPFRTMTTPGGGKMSVAITNCGHCGWLSDEHGYRYQQIDPVTHRSWPEMPQSFLKICAAATKAASFAEFMPDACLLNKYQADAKMGLHNDNDEHDLTAPIVSVSLGLDAVFLFGGKTRQSPTRKYLLSHGDVVVFGGQSRLNFHGISLIKPTYISDDLTDHRLNLTFRKVY